MTRQPFLLFVVTVVTLLSGVAAAPTLAPAGAAVAATSTASSAAGALVGAPSAPPARICGSRSLHGPATPPAGAVVVRPRQRLDAVVDRHRAGTTFWLASGRYTLGNSAYDQVQPKDGDTIIGGPNVVIDGRRTNRYAFGGDAVRVTLAHLAVVDFGTSLADNQSEGVVNHDAGHYWMMRNLTVARNGGAGVFLGTGDLLRDSCLTQNGQYGFSAYAATGVRNLRLVHNEIAGNDTADWERRSPGCGCSGGGKFWAVRNANVTDNWVHNNLGVGLWADTDNVGFLFNDNYISENTDVGLLYEISYNAEIVGNTFVRNAIADGPSAGFPQPALYVSESGSDPRAGSRFGNEFLIARNRFRNNFSGVVLWENANRYAGSPDNSSTGSSTLVDPRATVSACARDISSTPYINDCRWKTQNVRVRNNTFVFDPSAMPASCTPANGCGYVGVFSEWGSLPPFRADVVPDHISFHQNNKFLDNTYRGPWRFMSRELGTALTWSQWRSRPFGQDAGSVRQALS